MEVTLVLAVILILMSAFFLVAAIKLRTGKWLRYLAFNAALSDKELDSAIQRKLGKRLSLSAGMMSAAILVAFTAICIWEFRLPFFDAAISISMTLMFISMIVIVLSIVLAHREKRARTDGRGKSKRNSSDVTQSQKAALIVLAALQIAIQAALMFAIAQGSIS